MRFDFIWWKFDKIMTNSSKKWSVSIFLGILTLHFLTSKDSSSKSPWKCRNCIKIYVCFKNFTKISLISNNILKLIFWLWPSISQPNLDEIQHSGGVLESSGTAQSNDAPSFHVWARFMGVNKQNKISISFAKYCIFIWLIIN